MRLARISWLIVIVVMVITAAVSELREQLRLGLVGLGHGRRGDCGQGLCAIASEALIPYRERAATFVEQYCPKDAEMLMAAGMLTQNTDLLKLAAEIGNSPVAWAAYGERLIQTVPTFERIGYSGVDPADTEAMKEEKERIAKSGHPDSLTAEQAEAALSALHSWEDADLENGLPVAYEAWVLYGLHEDEDALATWAQAGRMTVVKTHARERSLAMQRLLIAMAMPKPEAVFNANVSLVFPSFALLRENARSAVYEGRLAAMHGDSNTALTWWESTADLGRHMKESSDTLIGFLVGVSIEGIGAQPVWIWVNDHISGIAGGPLLGGRLFWGDKHSLYVGLMGRARDRELRDSLVLAKLRFRAAQEYTERSDLVAAYRNANPYVVFAAAALVITVALLVIFVVSGFWSRFRTAWRGNLWRILPVTIALLALTFLGLSVYAAGLRAQWVAKWSQPGMTEMSDMISALGDEWTNPEIPADSWRAAYPPAPSGGGKRGNVKGGEDES